MSTARRSPARRSVAVRTRPRDGSLSTPTGGSPDASSGGSHWTGGRIAALLAGTAIAFIGVVLLLSGLALVLVHAFARGDDGYYTTGTERLSTSAYALTVEDVDLGNDAGRLRPQGRARPRTDQGRAPGPAPGLRRHSGAERRGRLPTRSGSRRGDRPRPDRVPNPARRPAAPAPGRTVVLGGLLRGSRPPGGRLGGRGRPLVGGGHERRRLPARGRGCRRGRQDRLVPGCGDRIARGRSADHGGRGGGDRARGAQAPRHPRLSLSRPRTGRPPGARCRARRSSGSCARGR